MIFKVENKYQSAISATVNFVKIKGKTTIVLDNLAITLNHVFKVAEPHPYLIISLIFVRSGEVVSFKLSFSTLILLYIGIH